MGLDNELARVKGILSGLTDALQHPLASPEDDVSPTAAVDATDAFDWSVTLGNVDQLIQSREAACAKLLAAEARAERAEARANKAEMWLRRLHEAVLKGLPAQAG